MRVLKKTFDFYIQSSIHVALSVYSLVHMTQFMFNIPEDTSMANFAFFGTIVGYNFVKYDSFARTHKVQIRHSLKLIILVSAFSFLAVGFYFFQLQRITQIVSVGVLSLTLLYTLPFFPNRKNARNWAGVKIYIVSLCWVGVTVILPILDSGIAITSDFYLKSMQRFLLVFVLILIFEIIDLSNDDPYLKTVPQQIGVRRTKNLGFFLLMIFCALEILNSNFYDGVEHLIVVTVIAVIVAFFLAFVNERRSRYYTSFWVESVPILWWLLLFLI